MKKKDVPQDEGACYEGHLRRLTWAEDEEGRYVGVPSTGWEAEIQATAVAAELTNRRIQAAWEDATAGRASPLAYHMQARQMDVMLLSVESGVARWRIKRHQQPGPFSRAGERVLGRYAEALGLDLDGLRRLPAAPELL